MTDLSVNQEQCINEVLNFIQTYKRYPTAHENIRFAHLKSDYTRGRFNNIKKKIIESKLPHFAQYMDKCRNSPARAPKDFKIKDLEPPQAQVQANIPVSPKDLELIKDINAFVATNKRFPLATEMYKFHRFKLRYYNDHENDPAMQKARQEYIRNHVPYFADYIELYQHYDQTNTNGPERTYDLETIKAFKKNQSSKKRKSPVPEVNPPEIKQQEQDFIKLGIENNVITLEQIDMFPAHKYPIKQDYKITLHNLAIKTYLQNNQPIPPEVYKQDLLYRNQQDLPSTKDYLAIGFELKIFDMSTIEAFKDKGIQLSKKYDDYSYGCILSDLLDNNQYIPPDIVRWYAKVHKLHL